MKNVKKKQYRIRYSKNMWISLLFSNVENSEIVVKIIFSVSKYILYEVKNKNF